MNSRREIFSAPGIMPRTLILLLLSVLSAAFVVHLVMSLSFPYPLEYGEGITINWILRLQHGLPLYPTVTDDSLPWLHNPYGPLWYILASPFQGMGNGVFMGARILSLLSFCFCCLLLFRLSRRELPQAAALGTTLLFAASPLIWRFALMARVDMTALVISLSALILIDNGPPSPRSGPDPKNRDLVLPRWTAAGVLAGGAMLIKPLFFAAALTGLVAGYRDWRRHGAPFIFGLAIVFIIAGAWLSIRGEEAPALHAGAMNRIGISPVLLLRIGLAGAARHPAATIIIGYGLLSRQGSSPRLWFARFSAATFIGAAKIGADAHYFIIPLAASTLLAAPLLRNRFRNRRQELLLWCLAAQLALYLPIAPRPVFTATYGQEIPAGHSALTPNRDDRLIGRYLSEEIGGEPGPILADDPGYLLAAGSSLQIQPFQYGRLAAAGRLSPEPLLRRLDDEYFSLIILRREQPGGPAGSDFPPAVVAAIRETYHQYREIGPYQLFIPPVRPE